MEFLQKSVKYLFPVILILLVYSFFQKSNFKNASDISPLLLKEPLQTDVEDGAIIKITNKQKGFTSRLKVVAEYDISGLVVMKRAHWFWESKSYFRDFINYDVGLIWGDNVRADIYKDKSLKFSHFEYYLMSNYSSSLPFNIACASNTHIIYDKPYLGRILGSVSPGDQINMKGKLVDVEFMRIDGNEPVRLYTSKVRTDTGVMDNERGACEVLYLEKIEILKQGNVLYHRIFIFSLLLAIIFIVLGFISFARKAAE